MHLNSLTAISPLDGRYFATTQPLAPYFSEYGLIRYRVLVEVEYFIALCNLKLPELKKFPKDKFKVLRGLYKNFNEAAAAQIKEIEKTTNHDVKAVEYYLKQEFDKVSLSEYKEFIHFGLTSQDINNTATPLLLKTFLEKEFIATLNAVVSLIDKQSAKWEKIPMLARTHGSLRLQSAIKYSTSTSTR